MKNPFRRSQKPVERDNLPYALNQWLADSSLTYNGTTYNVWPSTSYNQREENVPAGFEGLIQYAYRSNGVVFAVELARLALFSQVRFQFQPMRNGEPGKLFGTSALSPLEKPWPGGTTQDLLAGIIQDADFAGNSFTRLMPGGQLERMRPDWTTIVAGSRNDPNVGAWDPGAQVLGYLYHVGGRGRSDPIAIPAEQVAHFAPIPDPVARWRGMSWLNPILSEVMADTAATTHKLKFFENGATVNLAAVFDPQVKAEEFNQWVDLFEKDHVGAANAWKTLYLGGGADLKVIGANLKEADFSVTQAAGEQRICADGGVPSIIAGVGPPPTYENFAAARRQFSDFMHWMWGNAAGSLEQLIPVPGGSRLWYDAEHIPFLREDSKDQAAVQLVQSQAIRFLVDAGYKPDAVVTAVASGDMTVLLGAHSGLYSVQLQPAGSMAAGDPAPPTPMSGMPPGRSLDPLELLESLNGNGHQSDFADLVASRVSSPHVEVSMPEIRTDVHIPGQPPSEVTVNVPEMAPPVVNVTVPPSRRTRKRIERDEDGRAVALVEEDAE